MTSKALGSQLLVEYYGCDREFLNDVKGIETAMQNAAIATGATIVENVFHEFAPHGVSGVVVIAESHLAIHTWPEHGYAAVDLFTCGSDVDPMKGFNYLQEVLKAESFSILELKRGLLADTSGKARYKPMPEKEVA